MPPSSSYDDFPSLPSMPTVRAGDARDALGRIDQYDLLRKLGGGGFGVVYLARDTASGVEVAIKTLHPLLKANAEEMEALREKFRLVHALTHPNIAKALVLHPVRDINVWDEAARQELRLFPGDSVMVMDYAPGVTLSKWRRQFPDGVVPLGPALEIGRQLASALDFAHGERIVHRDVKPSNVVVETLPGEASPPSTKEEVRRTKDEGKRWDGPQKSQLATDHLPLVTSKIRARILDFGLAAEIRSSMSRVSSETGDTSGTRPYMAPEQWLGRKQDGRTDQYALACVLYELLSGAPPFAGVFETGDPVIMMATVKGEAPEEIEGVQSHVNAALQKALAKDPKERFASCADFVAALKGRANSPSEPFGGASTPCESTVGMQASPPPQLHTPARPEVSPHHGSDSTAQEAEVLRRKLSLARTLKKIPEADRADKEFSKFLATAEDEMAIAEEAIRLDKFSVAAGGLDRVESALDDLRKAHDARKEAARKAKEDVERIARGEAERKEREESERIAREKVDAERKAREEAERLVCVKTGSPWRSGCLFPLLVVTVGMILPAGLFPRQEDKRLKVIREEETRILNEKREEARILEERQKEEKSVLLEKKKESWLRKVDIAAKGVSGTHPGQRKLISLSSNVAMPFRWCPPGSFKLQKLEGYSFDGVSGKGNVSESSEVSFGHGFWIGEREVTQGEWKAVMRDEGLLSLARRLSWSEAADHPEKYCGDIEDDLPIYYVSNQDAEEFCKRLTDRERESGNLPSEYSYRLPTSEEWEYACFSGVSRNGDTLPDGSKLVVHGKNNAPALGRIAWYAGNSPEGFSGIGWDMSKVPQAEFSGSHAAPRRVGSLPANEWGIFDMLGNVREWCGIQEIADIRSSGPCGGQIALPQNSGARIVRGGSWRLDVDRCRPNAVNFPPKRYRANDLGFRVVLAPTYGE